MSRSETSPSAQLADVSIAQCFYQNKFKLCLQVKPHFDINANVNFAPVRLASALQLLFGCLETQIPRRAINNTRSGIGQVRPFPYAF